MQDQGRGEAILWTCTHREGIEEVWRKGRRTWGLGKSPKKKKDSIPPWGAGNDWIDWGEKVAGYAKREVHDVPVELSL